MSVSPRCKIGSGSVGHVYAGKYEQHPVAIKQHKLDGSQLDQKALQEFEIEVQRTPCEFTALCLACAHDAPLFFLSCVCIPLKVLIA